MNKFQLALISIFLLFLTSCQKQAMVSTDDENNSSEELWEGGIHQLTGIVEKVDKSEKGQYLTLLDVQNNRKFVWVIDENLKNNSPVEREFSVGEYISFRGSYDANGDFIAIEILETM